MCRLPRLAVLALGLSPAAAAQTTWWVDVNGTPPGSGTPEDPYTSLAHALAQSSTGPVDQLLVRPGTYLEQVDFLGKGVAVRSTDGPDVTFIDAGGVGSAVTLAAGEGPDARLEGFTVMGGFAGQGAGLRAVGAKLTVVDCRFVANEAWDAGGGLWLSGGVVTLVDSSVEDTPEGGALHAEGTRLWLTGCRLERNRRLADLNDWVGEASGLTAIGGVVTLVDCQVQDNGNIGGAVDRGGGLYAEGGRTTLLGCTFEGNRCEVRGGAVAAVQGDLWLLDCVLVENEAADLFWGGGLYVDDGDFVDVFALGTRFERNRGGDGGGAYVGGGDALFAGCTFVGNVAEATNFIPELGRGGGLCVAGGNVQVRRTVFQANEARGDGVGNGGLGGGVYGPAWLLHCTLAQNQALPALVGLPEGGGAWGASLVSSIVWGNAPDQLAGGATAGWSDVQGGWPGSANMDADPLFWGGFGADLHLRAGSPCIDTGDPSRTPDPDGSPPDIGAYWHEPDYVSPPVVYCEAKPSSQGCLPRIGFTGQPSVSGADEFQLHAEALVPHEFGFLLWSLESNHLPYYGGVLCLAPPLARLGLLETGGDGAPCSGGFQVDVSQAFLAANALGLGTRVYGQFWYRDSGLVELVGLTDAVEFVVAP